jgi:hypothetical protein
VCASNSLYIHSVESRELRRGRWRIAREPLANRQLGSSQAGSIFKSGARSLTVLIALFSLLAPASKAAPASDIGSRFGGLRIRVVRPILLVIAIILLISQLINFYGRFQI